MLSLFKSSIKKNTIIITSRKLISLPINPSQSISKRSISYNNNNNNNDNNNDSNHNFEILKQLNEDAKNHIKSEPRPFGDDFPLLDRLTTDRDKKLQSLNKETQTGVAKIISDIFSVDDNKITHNFH